MSLAHRILPIFAFLVLLLALPGAADAADSSVLRVDGEPAVAQSTAVDGAGSELGVRGVDDRPVTGSIRLRHTAAREDSVGTRGGVAAKTADDVVRALSATERRTLDDALRPDKLDHIFDPKHNFQPLVQQFGSREAAMEQVVRSIGGPLPQAGKFEIARSIGGQTVVIRGAVVDGIPRIGTAFTP